MKVIKLLKLNIKFKYLLVAIVILAVTFLLLKSIFRSQKGAFYSDLEEAFETDQQKFIEIVKNAKIATSYRENRDLSILYDLNLFFDKNKDKINNIESAAYQYPYIKSAYINAFVEKFPLNECNNEFSTLLEIINSENNKGVSVAISTQLFAANGIEIIKSYAICSEKGEMDFTKKNLDDLTDAKITYLKDKIIIWYYDNQMSETNAIWLSEEFGLEQAAIEVTTPDTEVLRVLIYNSEVKPLYYKQVKSSSDGVSLERYKYDPFYISENEIFTSWDNKVFMNLETLN